MSNEEKKVVIDDSDVRFGAGLYKLIIRIMGVIIIGVFAYNTFQIGNVAYKTYKNWNNEQELQNYAIELTVDNEIYRELDYEDYTKEDFTEEGSILDSKTIVIGTYIKIVIFEVYLIFLFMFYLNVYNFLENKNLVNPFTSESVSFLSLSIRYGSIAFIISIFLGDISSISYLTLLVLFLIRYIIRKGNEMME